MKKRFIAAFVIILIFACCATLVACSDKNNVDPNDEDDFLQPNIPSGPSDEEQNKDAENAHSASYFKANAATCTDEGNVEYWYCDDCKKYFSDSDCKNEISLSDTVISRHPTKVFVAAKEEKCFENGTEEHYHCDVCGKNFDGDNNELSSVSVHAAHKFVDGVCSVCNLKDETKGLEYELSADKTYYTVIGIGYTADKSISVPKKYKDLDVKVIGPKAFANGVNIVDITIPDGVTTIEHNAFNGCSELAYINIPDSVTSIGVDAFSGCGKLKHIDLPEKLTSIGAFAFMNCASLTEITIPDSVTSIGNYAFEYCGNLKSVTLSKNIKSIGNYVFMYCGNLIDIKIPDGVESIGENAFANCVGLRGINIPASVKTIGEDAFQYCYKLVEVYNSSELEVIAGSKNNGYVGYYALAVYDGPAKSKLSEDEDGFIVYTDGDEKLLVCYVGEKTELTLPKGITAINKYAFYQSATLTSVTVPVGVKSVGAYSFMNCGKLQGVTLPDGLSSIGVSAFQNCAGLTNITIPGSVASIGGYAFRDCYKLVEVCNKSDLAVTKGEEDYGYVGYYALNVYSNKSGRSKLTSDAKGYVIYTDDEDRILVGYKGAATTLTLPSYITEIYRYAFYNCNSITDVTIGQGVKKIGDYALSYCDSLTSVHYLGSLETWCGIVIDGTYANPLYTAHKLYLNDKPIEKIEIPETVTSIGQFQFYGWNGSVVVIPETVTSIGDSAFYDCKNLSNIYYKGSKAQWENVTLGIGNGILDNVCVYSETNPFEGEASVGNGSYWHYVDDEIIVWTKNE